MMGNLLGYGNMEINLLLTLLDQTLSLGTDKYLQIST